MKIITLDDIKKAYFSLQDIDQLLDQYCEQTIDPIVDPVIALKYLQQYDPDFISARKQAKKDDLSLNDLDLVKLTYLSQKYTRIAQIMVIIGYRVTNKTLAYN